MTDHPFTPEEIRSFLRECVTVVKPGEILVVRMGAPHYTPQHCHEVQDIANEMARYGDWPRVMVVPGDELGVIEAGETVHACPPDDGGGLMPCCGRTPFEVPRTDRMALIPDAVTCTGAGDG